MRADIKFAWILVMGQNLIYCSCNFYNYFLFQQCILKLYILLKPPEIIGLWKLELIYTYRCNLNSPVKRTLHICYIYWRSFAARKEISFFCLFRSPGWRIVSPPRSLDFWSIQNRIFPKSHSPEPSCLFLTGQYSCIY